MTTIYEFPKETWIENIAVRSNGHILLTQLSSPPTLYSLDPFAEKPEPVTVHTFESDDIGFVGIHEREADVFYYASLNAEQTGEGKVWRVDMTSGIASANVSLVADIPESLVLNGVTAVPGSNKILIADYFLGLIWRVDTDTKAVDIGITSPALAKPKTGTLGGVNGIRASDDGFLYFTNTGDHSLGRIPIDENGTATGDAEILFQNQDVEPDDFALRPGTAGGLQAVIADMKNRIVHIGPGSISDYTALSDVRGPTAPQFGRAPGDEKNLYITTSNGKLIRIDEATSQSAFEILGKRTGA